LKIFLAGAGGAIGRRLVSLLGPPSRTPGRDGSWAV